MASNEPTECGVCSEEFDEGARCPRILECFHHLCSHCIHQMIKAGKTTCPFCRRGFQAKSAADVRVNTGVLDLVKYISGMDLNAQRLAPTSQDKGNVDEDAKDMIGYLSKKSSNANNRILTQCQDMQDQTETLLLETKKVKVSIGQENTKFEREIQPKVQQVMTNNLKNIRDLSQTETKLQSNLAQLKLRHTYLQNAKEMIDASNSLKDAASAIANAEEQKTSFGTLMKILKDDCKKGEETLQGSKKKLQATREKSSIMVEILNFHEGDETATAIPNIEAFSLFRTLPEYILAEDLVAMKGAMKDLIEQGRIFVLQEMNGRKRSARLSISGKKLLLHHFEEIDPLPGHYYLQYQEVLKLESDSLRLTFLDMKSSSTSLGRVYIRLLPETRRSTQFSLLCTGEMGYSYTGLALLDAWPKGTDMECIRGGYSESNCDDEMKSLLPQVSSKLHGQQQPWLSGMVEGVWGTQNGFSPSAATQFVIKIHDKPSLVCPFAFGMVEEGLDVVKAALVSHSEMTPVHIVDCGIVLFPSIGTFQQADTSGQDVAK